MISRESLFRLFDNIPTINGLGLEPLIALRDVKEIIKAVPEVDAVPLEPLARFIVENLDPRVDCESCVSDVENADRDCRNCPQMSEEQVLDALEKWMEEQNA